MATIEQPSTGLELCFWRIARKTMLQTIMIAFVRKVHPIVLHSSCSLSTYPCHFPVLAHKRNGLLTQMSPLLFLHRQKKIRSINKLRSFALASNLRTELYNLAHLMSFLLASVERKNLLSLEPHSADKTGLIMSTKGCKNRKEDDISN